MGKICLVTISDADFSIGTEVLLYSFHKYNPDFDGEVIVLCEDLPDEHRQRLSSVSPARFESPDPRLHDAVRHLQQQESRLAGIYRRLFSLEAFRLEGYDRVLYLDSDIYCTGDIGDLFASREALLACPDGFTYADQIDSFLGGSEAPTERERYGRRFTRSFNAGVLSIGPQILGEKTYTQLLDWLKPERWKEIGPGKFTDQMLLNLHFEGEFTPLAARFNYMIFLEGYQKLCEAVSFLDARLVHFAGSLKPWFEYDGEVLARRAPQFIKFFDAWRELLDEARGPADPGEAARQYRRQQDWIREYNEAPIEPIGRLY